MKQIKWVGAHPNNYSEGRDGTPIRRFIVHATEGSMQSTANWFANPKAKVSAHYGIDKYGNIEQYVDDANVAFHAGNFQINKDSIGIELEDIMDGVEPTAEQYETIAWLIHTKGRLYGVSTIEPHNKYRATLCPGDTNMNKIIEMVADLKEVKLLKQWKVKSYGPYDTTQQPVIRVDDVNYIVHVAFKKPL